MFERNRIAETLRNARERRGLTPEETARAAGIPLQYLRLLEGESNVRIGVSDELYLIPFFRKYASFMSIDAEELLPEFLGMVQQVPGEAGPPIRLAYRRRYASLWKPVAVLMAIAIAVTLLLRQTRERPTFEESDVQEAIVVATPRGLVPTPPPMPSDDGPRPTEAMPTGSAIVTPTATITPTETSVDEHLLAITAKEDAWLTVGVDDQPAKQYLLRGGESRAWNGQRFSLTVGNAGGVALTLDGRELPPIGRPGQVVRNLRFPVAP